MKFRVFCDVAPGNDVEVNRRFIGAYYFHHQGDDQAITALIEAVRTYETSVNFTVTTRSYIPEDSKLNYDRCFHHYLTFMN
jgi:hypothetical protein